MARILLIDDDDSVRAMLERTLGHFGHAVVAVRNGQEGLEQFEAVQPELVITDLVMPEKEGFEVLAGLRNKLPRVPIIVITGGVRGNVANYLDMAMRLGASRVLAKPFSSDELVMTINLLLPAAPGPAVAPSPIGPA